MWYINIHRSMDKDIKKQERRIEKVFPKGIKDFSKNSETLLIYKGFLDINLDFPI